MKALTSILVLLLYMEVFVNASVLPENQQLIEASTSGNTNKVKNILQTSQINTVDIDNSFIKAIENGHNEIVIFLLQNNANVNVNTNDGETALMFAAKNGNKEIVDILIQNDAKVNARMSDGKTALMFATENGHKEIVEKLIHHGAFVNTRTIMVMQH